VLGLNALTDTALTRVLVEAQAKVNWALELLGERDDGYHEIATLLQGVDLCDTILLEKTEGGIAVTSNDSSVPGGPENLAWQAARLVQEAREISRGVRITIEKRIPVAAGLGGGSSDAAAVLVGLQQLWDLRAASKELRAWATSLGMDVPFFLTGGRALAEGRGERLTPLPSRPAYHVVAVNPNFPLITREVYRWAEGVSPRRAHGLARLAAALAGGNAEAVGALLHNDLEGIVALRYPEVGEIRKILQHAGARGVVMSGSGPTMLALAASQSHAAALAAAAEGRGWSAWKLMTVAGPAVRVRRLPLRPMVQGEEGSRARRGRSGSPRSCDWGVAKR